jgi:ribosomal protein S18 acetylase RimI-like enzyme
VGVDPSNKWRFDHGVVVEQARRRDALPILGLHRSVLEEGRYFISYPDEFERSLGGLTDAVVATRGTDRAVWLVARKAGLGLAGFLVVSSTPLRRTRHIGRLEIMVAPSARGAGVGRALMTAAMAWARASLLTKISLVVFADNAPAVALYKAFDFVEEGRRKGEYVEEDGSVRDDVLMACSVG